MYTTVFKSRFSKVLSFGLLAALLPLVGAAPATAQTAESVGADLRMAQDAAPFRRAADDFVASAMAGDGPATLAMLSRALVSRSGVAAIRQALYGQILPFFQQGSGTGRSVTVTRTTDAAGQQGFAFYMWLQPAGNAPLRPFTVYVTQEDGRAAVANVVPDRLVEGRHR